MSKLLTDTDTDVDAAFVVPFAMFRYLFVLRNIISLCFVSGEYSFARCL